ncbi:MAG: lysylphosphatidylglycerol synthase transmembrane domain-containing protein [Anaerolineaceae bacterium]|nr:lysylphosphatidylglycerol synthase transmembrane domain-containing protein [Anaerolineaceae bacterium]
MRKFIIAIALLLTVVFVIGKFAEVQNIITTIQRGKWVFLVLAFLLEGVWIFNVGALYRTIFKVMGIVEALLHMVSLSAAANFFNIIAPSGGMGGLMVFISDARRNGYSSARATVSGALYVLFDYAGLLLVLPPAFSFLFQSHKLNWPEIIAAILLLLLGCGLAFLLYLGMHSAIRLGQALNWLARRVNWLTQLFSHRNLLSEERAYSFASEAAEGVRQVRLHPGSLLPPLALALGNKVLMILVLMLIFLAFQVPFTFGILVAGFSMAYLFLIMSPTPSGIGFVEGVLTISLHSMGVPLDDAAVITLVYRGFTFWIPFLFGFSTFRYLTHARKLNPAVNGKTIH